MKYSYNCSECAMEVDVDVPMSEYDAEKDYECPICKSKLTKDDKVWSSIGGINLNGVGFGVSTFKGDC